MDSSPALPLDLPARCHALTPVAVAGGCFANLHGSRAGAPTVYAFDRPELTGALSHAARRLRSDRVVS